MASSNLQRLDRLPITSLHLAIVVACALSLSMDTLDVAIGTAMSTVLSAPPYSMASRPLSWIVSSIFLGAILGAPLLSRVADRRGLRSTLAATMVWLGATTALTTASANTTWLIMLRFLTGISVGALPPLLIAYVTETAPARYRGLFIFWVCAVAYLAPPVTLFAVRWLTPLQPLGLEGWRWPFLVAGVVALAIGVGFRSLPESPRWLLANRRLTEAQAVSHRFESARRVLGRAAEDTDPIAGSEAVVQSSGVPDVSEPLRAALNRRFPLIGSLYFLSGWVTAGFPLLTGPILLQRGYDLSSALLYVALMQAGPSIGTLAVGTFIDRVPRRFALVAFAACTVAAIVVFFRTSTTQWMVTAVIAYGIAVALYVPVLTIYGAEIFPTHSRTSATAAAWAINRLASTSAPLLLLPMLQRSGATAVAASLYAAVLSAITIILLFGPKGLAGASVK